MKLKKLLERYVDEALGDDIPDYMKDFVKTKYDDKYLDMDVPEHTDIIPNVKIEVKDENITQKSIGEIVDYFSQTIIDEYWNSVLHSKLKDWDLDDIILKSLGLSGDEHFTDIRNRSAYITHLANFYRKKFRLLIAKDNNLFDPKFSNNTSGLGKFLQSAQRAFPDKFGDLDINRILKDKRYVGLRDPILNYHVNKKQVENAKLYLYISDKPDDKLRMSISKFYDSCQNLYTGSHNRKLLANVFDGNSKVAYLIFDTPFRDSRGNTHPFTAIARTILRVNEEGGVMFDKVYPMDMADVFYQIIGEYTELENVGEDGDVYHFKSVGLPAPYMDMYALKTTGVGENFDDNERVQALITITDASAADVEQLSDEVYKLYGNEEWLVTTHDDALEQARDYLHEYIADILHDHKLDDLLRVSVISLSDLEARYLDDEVKSFISNVPPEEEDEEEDGDYDSWTESDQEDALLKYLEEQLSVTTFGDLELDYHNAYQIVDINQLIEYMGGEHRAIEYALATYDGTAHQFGELLVIRVD